MATGVCEVKQTISFGDNEKPRAPMVKMTTAESADCGAGNMQFGFGVGLSAITMNEDGQRQSLKELERI